MTAMPTEMILRIDQEIEINAAPEAVFAVLLEHLGEQFGAGQSEKLNLKLEPWPGGRWFRDLGDSRGHLWGHVQVFKPPTLLELYGPMFMSCAAVSHLQVRLTERGKGTLLALRHEALGLIKDEQRQGVTDGWRQFVQRVKQHVER